MINRHATFYIKDITPIDFCGKILYQMNTNGAFELPFDIEPTTGEHDYTKCEECKKSMAGIITWLTKRFDGYGEKKGFPFCCSPHSNLVKVKEFNRSSFTSVPTMVANKVIYTNQHIINNHSIENWYKTITDYIEWAVQSFGQIPLDCGERLFLGEYFHHVTYMLKSNNDIAAEKRSRLLEFVSVYQTPSKNPKTNFNILVSTYQKWLKQFPFELNSYFGDLKLHFENQLPMFDGERETNIYSGMSKVKMHTESSLIIVLVTLTKQLLGKINAKELVEQGIISDINKHRFELESESLRIATSQITNDFSQGELKYIKALKKWLRLHKMYFKEIGPLMYPLKPKQMETKTAESEQYIKPELLDRLNEVESKMNPIIETFRQSKIKCSAWVELLMEKGYFEIAHKNTIRKSCIGFAKLRYGIDVTAQMNTAKKNDRNSHKQQLSKYLK